MLAKLKNKLKSKQGITLVELLVTIALMAMVTGLTIQLAHSFLQSYSIVQARWRTQNAAQQVMQFFRLQNESLSNSASISLFYTETEQPVADYEDPTDMQGVTPIFIPSRRPTRSLATSFTSWNAARAKRRLI